MGWWCLNDLFNLFSCYLQRSAVVVLAADVRGRVLRIIGNDVLVFGDALTVEAVLAVATGRTFGGGTVGYTVAAAGVEAEQLRAHSIIFLQA